jgi:hypothetical protein
MEAANLLTGALYSRLRWRVIRFYAYVGYRTELLSATFSEGINAS